jgi:uncharacterized MAPEG superfamily protein
MRQEVYYLAASAILTFVMVWGAGLVRVRVWTWTGFIIMFGNRENLPPATPLAGRADRAAKNMLEGMVLFVTVMLAAQIAGATGPRVALGAQVFFWARLLYYPVYLAGIKFVRSAVWGVSIVGLGIILSALVV